MRIIPLSRRLFKPKIVDRDARRVLVRLTSARPRKSCGRAVGLRASHPSGVIGIAVIRRKEDECKFYRRIRIEK